MMTIKDIARALGVAPSTVTRALAGHPRISAETMRKVREKAEAMGYVADLSARAMQSGTSALVGLLVPDIQNSFYASMARTVAEQCRNAGYQLVLAVTEDDPLIEEQHIRTLIGARCAGVLLVPSGQISSASARLLAGVPTVQLVRRSDKLQADGVGIDDRKALANATGLLLDLGHTRIGLLLGEAQLDTARARQAGYEDAHIARGLTPDPTLIQVGSPRARHGHDATSELLNLKIPPSSILSAGAALTEGMLDAVSEHYGTAEPTVSLLGFGDNSAFRWWRNAGLSTITLPIADIAATACERLFERITKGSAAQTNYVFVCLDTGVALRGTTTPPPLGQGQ